MGNLRGNVTVLDGKLTGTLSVETYQLKGTISVTSIGATDIPVYEGETIVIPRAHDDVVLATAGTMVETDIVVLNVPMYETSNPAGGTTVYIARE